MQATVLGALTVSHHPLTQLDMSVAAGFPNPCEDYLAKSISLDELMINRPSSTFLVKVSGDSMMPTIPDGAILVVDKSITASHGKIVVAVIDGQFVVKELCTPHSHAPYLHSHNPEHQDIMIPAAESDWQSCIIWGTVTGFIKQF
ncbi:MAG: DNA polymerase V [Moritella sp.]|jgi:DNA polymerase V